MSVLSVTADTSPAPTGPSITAPENFETTIASVPMDPPAAESKAPEAKADPARPAWLPEKYKTPEEFAKAHQELEKKLGAPKADAPKPDETPAEAVKPGEPLTPDAAQAAVAKAGLDMAQLEAEFRESGALSEDSAAKLEAAGITKATQEQFIKGQTALREAYKADVAKAVGGEESLDKLLKWAGTNLSESEIAAADSVLSRGEAASSKLVLAGLQARYEATNGREPSLVSGSPAPAKGVEPFKSTAQMLEAMGDGRYERDPAYRDAFMARLALSDVGFSVSHG